MAIKAHNGATLPAKLRIELTTELFRACCEARKELAAKLKKSSFDKA